MPPARHRLWQGQTVEDVLTVEAELARSEGIDPAWPGFAGTIEAAICLGSSPNPLPKPRRIAPNRVTSATRRRARIRCNRQQNQRFRPDRRAPPKR